MAVPLPFRMPVIEVVSVSAGVAPPEEEPVKPFAETTDTAVTVPCGCAVQLMFPAAVVVSALVPLQFAPAVPVIASVVVVALVVVAAWAFILSI